MTPERFDQMEKLYRAARERTVEEREALLALTDPEMRRAVESLLAQREARESLERPATLNAPELSEHPTVTGMTIGLMLGPYRIGSKLGEGGMGEVFRAIDTRLDRPVAIKMAREQFNARFEREARAISSLNHPHICTLYDVGPNYLVMELLEGETIASRLRKGPLPAEDALRHASQIAAALSEAHGKGIVHRDLKPSNIMLAKSGVKVLDFGLAKAPQDETVTGSLVVVGTPAYMAPEQREGKPADARSDIYSFGRILYEMLSGARPGTPRKPLPSRRLDTIVSRCMEEDPARRCQSVAELERELAGVPARGKSGKTLWAAAAALLVSVAGAYFYFQRAAKLGEKDTIILADFDNKTGDAVFDDTLRQGLSIELQQAPFGMVSDLRVRQELALMGQARGARLTPEIARDICARTGSAAVLEGSISPVGSQYVLGLRARNCQTGNVLDQQQVVAARREDVLDSLGQIARKFRIKVGESLAAVESRSPPLAQVTTPSLEALKAYTTGVRMSGNEARVPFFRRAAEIDPQFAMAHAYLGLVYSATGDTELAAQSTRKARLLRDRVSDRERFFIDFTFERQVNGNLEKAYQILDVWSQTYPRGEYPNPQDLMAGISTHGTGRFDRALEAATASAAVDPDFALRYSNFALIYIHTNRFEEAEKALQRGIARKLDSGVYSILRYHLAFFRNDREQMDRLAAQARGKSRLEHWMAHEEALALARSGRLRAARLASMRALDLAVQEGNREAAASYQACSAVWEALYGNSAVARKSAAAAIEGSKGRDVGYAAGLAFAFSGDSSRPAGAADDLEKRFPEDTFAKFTYVPVLRALASLGQGKAADSVERLQAALRYELAVNGLNFNQFYLGGLHSAYVRGQAYLAARRPSEAAAEFQKILQHRGLVGLDPIGALAHLQLGRVHVLSGDKAKAKGEYEAFITLWKDADADIPILREAKAEYARL